MKATILFDNGEVNFMYLEHLTANEAATLHEAIKTIENLQKQARIREREKE